MGREVDLTGNLQINRVEKNLHYARVADVWYFRDMLDTDVIWYTSVYKQDEMEEKYRNWFEEMTPEVLAEFMCCKLLGQIETLD